MCEIRFNHIHLLRYNHSNHSIQCIIAETTDVAMDMCLMQVLICCSHQPKIFV